MSTAVPDGIVMLQGRPYATWPYVLNKGHEAGLLHIGSELIQIPAADNGNVAIVKATVVLKGDPENLTFEAFGDASPASVKSNMVAAIIRLAETRAKGRAMRDSVNVGQTLIEEMPDDEQPPARPLARHEGKADTDRQERAADSGSRVKGEGGRVGTDTRHPTPFTLPPEDAEPQFCAECGAEVPANVAAVSRQKFGGVVLCVADGRARAAAAKAEAQT